MDVIEVIARALSNIPDDTRVMVFERMEAEKFYECLQDRGYVVVKKGE